MLFIITGKLQAQTNDCVAEAVFHEAVGESVRGQVAVAQVIMNRTDNKRYPNTPCKVVRQKRKGICQFSYLCTKKSLKILKQDTPRMYLAESISECVKDKECLIPELKSATVYYACDGRNKISPPRWDWSKLKFKSKIDNHCFYEEV